MKWLFEKIETSIAAAAFAEEGDRETAERILTERDGDEEGGRNEGEPFPRIRPHAAPCRRSGA